MRILILGAGVVGVSSAWHLLKDGHDVTVIDRALPAQGGASFGNAGLIAPGHSFAWASPKALKVLLKSFYRQDQAFRGPGARSSARRGDERE
ncbi:MAG: FAD-dependent oxidoreductase, partial [SAR324 cluster bacterium]|nr:FAD-dependent oxidoreductase [SAR324 cluster bacterium]